MLADHITMLHYMDQCHNCRAYYMKGYFYCPWCGSENRDAKKPRGKKSEKEFVEELICSPGAHEYYSDKDHPMKEDSKTKTKGVEDDGHIDQANHRG